MGIFYLGTKSSPTKTLTIAHLESHPSKRQVRNFQSRKITPGGAIVNYQLGLSKRFLDLNIRTLSNSERVNLEDFITSDAVWTSNSFEYEDAEGILWRNCFFWFDDFRFSQRIPFRYDSIISIISDGLIIGEEVLSFTINSTVSIEDFISLILSFTINSTVSIDETLFANNTLWSGSEADKLYLQSGQFTSTLKDSEDVSGVDNSLAGISYDGTNTPWIGAEADKLYLQSGQFTSTLKTSEAIGGVDTIPSDISWDGTNTPWIGSFADKLYLQSGQFTSTLKTSEAIGGVDNLPLAISWDGTNTPWSGSEASKLYLQSGQFTSTLKTSEAIGGVDTSPSGISWDGTNTPWIGNEADKLYLQSGQFTSTLKDSEDVSGVDNNTSGIDTNRFDLRLGI